jgi:hypothetical protein
MENFSKRTTRSLFAVLVVLMLGYGFCVAKLGGTGAPAVHCDRHLTSSPCKV